MTQNVRLQNLRDFTVQIRNEADQIVGTGIAGVKYANRVKHTLLNFAELGKV